VKLILKAAANLIVERGYDAVTMTGIAVRARTSAGSLYQYFPDKEAVMQALSAQLCDNAEELWIPLVKVIPRLPPQQIADRLVELIAGFIDERPAYLPLLDAPLKVARSNAARDRLRSRLADAFTARQPKLGRDDARLIANVTIQMLKGFGALYARGTADEKANLARETKLAIGAYLVARFQTKRS
jgi:AcrR family transcriptional regulator